ncbi:MAG: hypothetical protein RJA98_3367 [Pseudomonadota bacterium]
MPRPALPALWTCRVHRRQLMLGGLLPACASALAAPADPGLQALVPRALTFPRDHGSHPGARTEWWYLTGTLHAADAPDSTATSTAPSHGFQVTFFRSRTGAQSASAFAPSQLILAHAALTDVGAQRQWSDQRLARAGFGIAQASEADTAVRLRDWQLQRLPHNDGLSRYQTRIASEAGGFAFDFALQATQTLLLQGEQGWSRKGPQAAQASHYVSEPQLALHGTLTQRGRAPFKVRGRAWLDHEWSNSVLDPQAVGWDWIGINLHDGSALTAFQLRRTDGSALWAGGSHRSASGEQRSFGPSEVQFTPGRRWTSPVTRASYPVAWTVRTPLGTHRVQALLDAQELGAHAAGTVYWEGVSALQDAASRTVGHGYLEMTGYAAPLAL